MKVTLIIFVHFLAVIAGLYYYWDQLLSTSPLLLIFVPDCPLYVLLALPLLLNKTKSIFYSFFVSSGLVKYGFWTVFVLLFYSEVYFAPAFFMVSSIFLLGHIGMVLEGLYFLPKAQLNYYQLFFITAWFLINDFADYYLGTVPSIPFQQREIVVGLAVASSFVVPTFLFVLKRDIAKLKEKVLWLS